MTEPGDERLEPSLEDSLDELLFEGALREIEARREPAARIHAELLARISSAPETRAARSRAAWSRTARSSTARRGRLLLAAAAAVLAGVASWSHFSGSDQEPLAPTLADASDSTSPAVPDPTPPLRIRREPAPAAEEFPLVGHTDPAPIPDAELLGEEERERMVRELGLLVQDVAQLTSYLASRVPRVGDVRVLH